MGDREVIVRLRADISQYQRALATASAETQAFGRSTTSLKGPLGNVETQSKSAGNEIDKLSGRLRVATDAALILAPALIPLGAAAVGGVVALSAALGATAGALGVTLLAVHGLDKGMKALNAYQLDPSATNLAKLRDEMDKLGPSGEHFVRVLDALAPNLKTLQNAARDGLLPGLEESITSLLGRLPEVRKLIRGIATEVGDLAAGGGKAVAGPGFDAFFKYLRTDGIKILDDTAKTAGNLAEVVANLFVAFGGVSTDFSGGLLKFSQGLADASANLESNAGFQNFVTYIQTEGPHALDTLASLANALLQIVEATAPLGGPVLSALGSFADIIATIADSDIGTPIFVALAAMALFNRTVQVTQKLNQATWGGAGITALKTYSAALGTVVTAQDRATMSAKELAAAEKTRDTAQGSLLKSGLRGAQVAGALAISMSGVADNTGLANTAMLSMAGPWGTAAGFALDVWHATDGLDAAMKSLDGAMASNDINQLTAALKQANDELEKTRANTVLGTSFLGDSFGGIVNAIAPMSNAAKFMGALTGDTKGLAEQAAAAQAQLDRLNEADSRIASGATAAVGPLRFLRTAIESNAEAANKQAAAIQGAIQAMHDMRQEALRAVNAELDYQQAIDDATAAVKKNGRTHDDTTEKGRDNLRALYNLAGAWNGQSEVIKGNSKQLQAARENFIRVAGSMGIAAGDARKLSRQLFDIPEKRQTQISTPGMDEATSKAKTLKQILDGLHSKDINIALHYQMLGNKPKAPTPGVPNADGGTVPKTGMGYADRHLYLLADGEEVISNRYGQADRYRSLLKAINAGRKMASGGTAGWNAGDGSSGGGHNGGGGGNSVQIWTDGVYSVAKALKAFKAELERAQKSIEREKAKRDELISAEQSFMSAVGGAYAKADLFSGGLSTFDIGLQANTNDTNAANAALAAAAANGLDGALYQALAASGNLTLLQEFAGLSASQIDIREHQFATQSAAQAALGTSAADAAGFTQAIKDQNKELRESRQERRELKAAVKSLEERLPGKVEDGARRGIAERQKRTHHQVRTG